MYRREVLKSLYRRGIILGCVMLETDRVYISYMAIAVILCAALLCMNYFTEYKDIKELTRDVVVKLICEVRVSENKEVEIVFDFDDCYKQLLESVEKLGYQVDKEPGGQLNISRREAV